MRPLALLASLLLPILVLVSPTPASAQAETRYCPITTGGVVVPLTALTSTVNFKFGPTVCSTQEVASYKYLVIEVDYTWATNGTITLTCLTGQSTPTANKVPQMCTGVGTCAMEDAGVYTKAVTASKKLAFRVGIRGYRAWSCSTTHSAPAAGDKVLERAYLTD